VKRQVSGADLASRTHDLEEANKTASFVAHELNNLLTVIQINTEFLLESVGENPANVEELQEIQRASRRASILARQPYSPLPARGIRRETRRSRAREEKAKCRRRRRKKTPRIAETILLVENEAAVRTLAKKLPHDEGLSRPDAADGAIAPGAAAAHVGEIDLVLTDVAMPNLGGRGMVEELKELSPGMRVLFMSGYPREEVFPEKEIADHTPYLQKPFTGDTLAAEVRSALGYAG
jgi:CheY-like chemotaxis protein